MLNGDPISWCSKKQATITLSSIEAKYIAFTLVAKEAIWLRLLFTKLGLLLPNQQHVEIRIVNLNSNIKAIKVNQINGLNVEKKEGEGSIALKNDNQGSIILVYNLVFHAQTKHIDI